MSPLQSPPEQGRLWHFRWVFPANPLHPCLITSVKLSMEAKIMSVLTAQVALVSESPSVSFGDLTQVAAALQKQVTRDFGPIWQVNGTVDAFDRLESVPIDYWPVILMDDIQEPGAAGYHTDDQGHPFALVQVDDS